MTSPLAGPPTGHVAIVTGGSRGVGRATVRRLAAAGYAVVVGYLHDQCAAESTVEAVLAGNGVAVAVRADVADALDVERLFAETTEVFGGVDVVVHAVGCRVATRVAEVGLDAPVGINTRATFIVTREAARHLRDGGAIVNLCSSARESSVSAATGADTDMLTRALATELGARDITVNAVSLEAGAPCVPDRVADVVAYLLSEHDGDRTGQVLRTVVSRTGTLMTTSAN